jgi:hypothetical protein
MYIGVIRVKIKKDIKKAHIKRFANVFGFKVWIVNGKYIRSNLDEEFTNFGEHYNFKFIPENEFWIDKERSPGEEKYFIESMLVMNRLMSKGVKDKDAAKVADRIERGERSKSKLMKKEMKIKKHNGNIIKTIHKSLIKKYSTNKLKIWIIRGEVVRDLFFLDFTEGGHDKVYNFIPDNEVWIDDDLGPDERRFVILHEIHERNLMSLRMKYDNAHRSSSEIEYYCRKHPSMTEKYIKKELKKPGNN